MKFMLDTNICIYIIKQKPARVLKRFAQYSAGDIFLSSVTLAELRYGVEKSLHVQQNHDALNGFTVPLEIASFDEKAADEYGKVRAQLEKKGQPIGSMDMLIGAHAISLGVTLVTNNTKEFRRIKGLSVKNWLK
ncbi:MAG: type II toxin-antitoxin system VapC family toxin [Nitrospirota bacterium]